MLIQLSPVNFLNFNHVIKIEAGNTPAEGCFVVFYHTINQDLKWTKVFFQKDEVARDAFVQKIVTAYENGDKICK